MQQQFPSFAIASFRQEALLDSLINPFKFLLGFPCRAQYVHRGSGRGEGRRASQADAVCCSYMQLQSFRRTNPLFSFFVAERARYAYSLVRISLAGAPIAQLDRALVYGTKGCRFNSCWARHFNA